MTQGPVAVIDFGGQYTQLIVRRVRELGIYSEMVPWTKADAWFVENTPSAVVLSGGPKSVLAPGAPSIDFRHLDGIPVLGICYGLQLMADRLGGKVHKVQSREYGERTFDVCADGILSNLDNHTVWMSHGDQVMAAPTGFTVTASTDSCPIAAFEDPTRHLYGVQFHPEVTHTPCGREILRRFVFDAAKLNVNWTSERFIEEQTEDIRRRVGSKKVLCAVSGGVDSMVLAGLLIKAIGEQAVCVFVDTGLLRKGEATQVAKTFAETYKSKLHVYDSSERFFGVLEGVTDPETKRKRIGAEFINVFHDHAEDLEGCDFLAQGTLYPDVIESGSASADTIKTHHNVGGLPDWLKLELIEPFRWLFKDEVRAVGRALGVPEEIVEREPFPGPGLAVRIVGEVTRERVAIVQEADWIFRSELRSRGLNREIWQSYAGLLDVKSVGVMGDERTYQRPIVLRAVVSEDAMTAKAANIPFEALEAVANRIVNEVSGVNRVLYDLTSKPPATIELE